VQETLDYIAGQAGTQFSQKLVDVFIPLILSDSRVPAVFYKGNKREGGKHEHGDKICFT
jgi:hypothetical protein